MTVTGGGITRTVSISQAGSGGGGTTCANPITFSGNTGNFNTTGAACYRTNANISGWGCYNFDGRTVTVSGVARTCGQMPLTRRIPKRGFTNPFRQDAQVVGLDDLAHVNGTEVTLETLVAAGLARASKGPVKLLANGGITRAVTVRGIKVSAAAREKIVAAGGKVEE